MGDLHSLEQRYRETVVRLFDKLTFKGVTPTGTPLTLPLADVYVSLTAVADVSADADRYSADERRLLLEEEHHGHDRERRMHLDSLRYARWQEESRRAARRRDRRAVEDILMANPAMVLLGDPGSGKTTLLHYLALVTARHALDADGAARPTPRIVQSWPAGTRVLPIFVPLAAYDDHLRRANDEIALGDYLACYYAKQHSLPGLAPLFAAALGEGRALVLLDGLDEVLDVATRIHVAAQTQSLFGQHRGRGNRFVVTSRVIGYREAPLGGLAHVTVMPFGDEEIAAFAHQWCAAYEAWARGTQSEVTQRVAVNEEKALLTDVNGNESVKRLAANPLLLTMLAILRRQLGALPDRRIELYERYVRTIIDHWVLARSHGARVRGPERFDTHLAIALLMELALWLQQNRPSGTARQRDIETALVDICLRVEGPMPEQTAEKERIQARCALDPGGWQRSPATVPARACPMSHRSGPRAASEHVADASPVSESASEPVPMCLWILQSSS